MLEAQARNVPGALLERCRLLWDRDKGHRAVMELQLVVQQQLEEGKHKMLSVLADIPGCSSVPYRPDVSSLSTACHLSTPLPPGDDHLE